MIKDIIFIGDGRGVRTYPAKMIGLNVVGTDISKFAVNSSYCKDDMIVDDIVKTNLKDTAKLIVVYDILEHITYEDIDKAINNIIKLSEKYILVSVPFFGTLNCNADPTHIIKEKEYWWQSKFENKGVKRIPVPDNWLFREQILLFEK